jgi:probable rRNA maturation factor
VASVKRKSEPARPSRALRTRGAWNRGTIARRNGLRAQRLKPAGDPPGGASLRPGSRGAPGILRRRGRPPRPAETNPIAAAGRSVLGLRNRQRTRRVDLDLLRRMIRWLLGEQLRVPRFELCFHLVTAREVTRVNEAYLGHKGSTDVITFDHLEARAGWPPAGAGTAEHRGNAKEALWGEIFISMDDALAQAGLYRTTWQTELARYAIHGVLHLVGYDDTHPSRRRRMKREEDRLLRRMAGQFSLRRLARAAPR